MLPVTLPTFRGACLICSSVWESIGEIHVIIAWNSIVMHVHYHQLPDDILIKMEARQRIVLNETTPIMSYIRCLLCIIIPIHSNTLKIAPPNIAKVNFTGLIQRWVL